MAVFPKPYPLFHAASVLGHPTPIALVEDTAWQPLGGVLTNVSFYTDNTNSILGRIVGRIRTQGSGVELRVVEVDPDDLSEIVLRSAYSIADTSGVWSVFAFTTTTPPSGVNKNMLYELRGRLNGATSADVQYVSMAMLQLF